MKIEKDNVLVRSANLDDATLLNKWWNDGQVMEHAGFPQGLNQSMDETTSEIKNWEGKVSQLCIIEIDGQPIGELSYRVSGDGSVLAGWKICEKAYQNQGYGSRIIRMLLNFIFTDKKINEIAPVDRVLWDTMIENKRAQYVYEEKIGARKLKINKDCWQDQAGNWRSSVDYEMKREDFFSAR